MNLFDLPSDIRHLAASPAPADQLDAMMRLVLVCFTGQLRRYEPLPLAVHSLRVGFQLARYGDDHLTILGGFGHDLLEDTAMTKPVLTSLFGADVAELVAACSLDESLRRTDRPRANQDLLQRVAAHGPRAIAIELVDGADNLDALGGRQPNWAMEEQRLALGVEYLGEQSPHVRAMANKLHQLRTAYRTDFS